MMRSLSRTLLALVVFAQTTFGQQQPQPDANCTAWLATPQGQNFTQCEQGFPGLPVKTPDNNCTVTLDDYNLLCNDSCFTTLTEGYDFILSTGTCLNLYEDRFGPCSTDDDCTGLGNQICFEDVCYVSCNTTDDCNSCNSETCDILGNLTRGCRNNLTTRNGTSSFRGNVYMLESACVTNDAGDYCSLLFSGISNNLTTVNCSTFDTWGCCLGTMLTSMEFCGFERFNDSSIYQCNASQITCSSLPSAQDFCAINNVNGTGNNGSSSSGISSGIGGSSSSSSLTGSSGLTGSSNMTSGNSNMTGSGGSSSSKTGHTGSSGVGGTGNDGNAAAGTTALISWSLLMGLLFVTPILS